MKRLTDSSDVPETRLGILLKHLQALRKRQGSILFSLGGTGTPGPGQDRRLPGVVTHSRLQRATSARSRVGIVLEDGSGVAIDWVTGRSYSSARRRLNVQSGLRRGRKGAAAPYPSVAVRDRGH